MDPIEDTTRLGGDLPAATRMRIPGFSAEASLHKTDKNYSGYVRDIGRTNILPQRPISDDEFAQLCNFFGGGAVSWPDGTRSCCYSDGHCDAPIPAARFQAMNLRTVQSSLYT
jgi:hypothetical protein